MNRMFGLAATALRAGKTKLRTMPKATTTFLIMVGGSLHGTGSATTCCFDGPSIEGKA